MRVENRALPLIALWLCFAPATLAEVTKTLHDKLTAYRRGNGDSRIQLRTSSGDASITPR